MADIQISFFENYTQIVSLPNRQHEGHLIFQGWVHHKRKKELSSGCKLDKNFTKWNSNVYWYNKKIYLDESMYMPTHSNCESGSQHKLQVKQHMHYYLSTIQRYDYSPSAHIWSIRSTFSMRTIKQHNLPQSAVRSTFVKESNNLKVRKPVQRKRVALNSSLMIWLHTCILLLGVTCHKLLCHIKGTLAFP